jgi:hypothetical protein
MLITGTVAARWRLHSWAKSICESSKESFHGIATNPLPLTEEVRQRVFILPKG